MGTCTTNPKSNWESFRYINKNATENERFLFSQYWDELVNRFGTRVEFYTYNYQLSSHDYIYGEEPTATYNAPKNIIALVDLASEALLLSKFGLQTDADMTAIVTVEDFRTLFGGRQPQSQDVLRLTEAGWDTTELPPTTGQVLNMICNNKDPESDATITYTVSDRDWVRCPQLFEVTERRWQDLTLQTNTLLGHYVWVLKCKRFDYSYQPGIGPECMAHNPNEESFTGIMSGGTQTPTPNPDKQYDQNANDEAKKDWDYANNEGQSTQPYGDY